METRPICVIGDGRWGLALAHHLFNHRPSRPLTVITRKPLASIHTHVKSIYPNWQNNISFKQTFDHLKQAEQTLFIIATPSHAVLPTMQSIANICQQPMVVSATKGFCNTNKAVYLQHQCYSSLFKQSQTFALLCGPTYAHEVYNNKPSYAVLATHRPSFFQMIAHCFNPNHFKLTHSTDLIGVALGSIYKNLIALGAGLIFGSIKSHNTVAAFITQGTQELQAMIQAIGGNEQTICSLACLGDVCLSATSSHSRNYHYGTQLSLGKADRTTLTESTINLDLCDNYFRQRGFISPLCQALKSCLSRNPPQISELLAFLNQPLPQTNSTHASLSIDVL